MLKLSSVNIASFFFKVIGISLFIVFLYCYIYNPPFTFLPLTPTKLSYVFLLPFLVWKKGLRQLFIRLFFFEFFILLIIIFYSFGIELLNGVSGGVFWTANLFMLFENFFFAFIIAYYLNKIYGEKADLLLLVVTAIAGFITLFLIVNPEINNQVKQSVVSSDDVSLKLHFRCFGIAESLTFAYAIVQGLAAALCLERVNNVFVCSILFILFCVSVMFNARIGFIPMMFVLLYMILVEKKGSKILKISMFFGFVVIYFLGTESSLDYEQTMQWAIGFFQEIFDTISGNESGDGNMEALLNDMVVLPTTLAGWIWGTGKNIYSSPIRNSDIGYFIQLNYGGIIYCFFFFLLIASLFIKLQNSRIKQRWYPYLFVVTILICSYKGLFVITNPGFRILMLMYFLYFLQNRTESIMPQSANE